MICDLLICYMLSNVIFSFVLMGVACIITVSLCGGSHTCVVGEVVNSRAVVV